MISIKSILGVAAVAGVGSLFFGKNKYDGYKRVVDNIKFKLKSVNGVNFDGGNVVFKADVEIINPTEVAVDVPGDKLVVKNIHFFTQSGNKLGVATPNLSEITLPANGSRIITNVPVVLDLDAVGSSFSDILSIVSDPSKLKVTADLEAFGKSFSI